MGKYKQQIILNGNSNYHLIDMSALEQALDIADKLESFIKSNIIYPDDDPVYYVFKQLDKLKDEL